MQSTAGQHQREQHPQLALGHREPEAGECSAAEDDLKDAVDIPLFVKLDEPAGDHGGIIAVVGDIGLGAATVGRRGSGDTVVEQVGRLLADLMPLIFQGFLCSWAEVFGQFLGPVGRHACVLAGFPFHLFKIGRFHDDPLLPPRGSGGNGQLVAWIPSPPIKASTA